MSASFPLRLSDLRKEKKLSQKEAAADLGISQALLSHYEKGIRECGLDFLMRASSYYDVTSDYLLGLTDSRHGLNDDIYTKNELSTDSQLKIKTLFRALVSLCEKLTSSGYAAENRLNEELLLSVYRFALLSEKYGIIDKNWFSIEIEQADRLSSEILGILFSYKKQSEKAAANAYEVEPMFLKTVINTSEDLLRKKYSDMLSIDKELK